MDEGSSHSEGTLFLRYFDVSPDGFAWRGTFPEQIRQRRADLDDKLIFDTLLISGGVKDPDFIFPPHDVAGLKRLLDAIEASTYDALKKQTLIYFLLKWHQDGREDIFTLQHCIPPHFSALADAYWHLDSGINLAKAISILSDSRLNRDFTSKIIRAITLAPEHGPLLRKYIRTVKPPLVEPMDLLSYIDALAESTIVEAWNFQRTFPENDEIRPRLFKRILHWALAPTPKPKALKELLSIPFNKYEEDQLNEFASKPSEDLSTASVARLQDLVCVRYIELGRYADAIKMDRKFSATVYDGKESSERRTMIRELYDALPAVEKSLIDMPAQAEKPKPAQPPSSGDVSMSQSWEDVRVPEALNKSTSTPLKNIQIPTAFGSNTPRFTVPTTTTIASAGNAAAPLLPLNSTPANNTFTPRKSMPLQSNNPLNASLLASTKGKQSLSGAGQRIAMNAAPGVSSPASGLRFPLQTPKSSVPPPTVPSNPVAQANSAAAAPPPPVFKSTTNQPNAFFQPKASQTNQKRLFADVEQSPEREPVHVAEDDGDTTMEVEHEEDEHKFNEHGKHAEDEVPGWKAAETEQTLNQSIFGTQSSASYSVPEPRISTTSRGRDLTASESREKPKSKRQQPPGAFGDDDGDDDGQESPQEKEEEPQPQSRRRLAQPRAGVTRGRESKAAPKAPRGRTSRPSATAIPGTLTEEDHHDEIASEEVDQVAPLRDPSPPSRSKRPLKKSRSVASTSDYGDDETGPTTRRRSSRLTATTSHRNLSPESVKGETSVSTAKPVKKSRASATKKKK
ncbi:hypothetical protein FA15DRAFT_691042 [Coprinopsis marcescibilis]|uniref:ELYS-like domain-containing protein n=1 Tax=Coprinopsis marcescibilis TaxID=230819 RepID=A0A5C3LAI4_COPMA|nr:hypothetical protein FA15DRAFT_691042 [Coprinopsis marcescibilis]